MSRYNPHMMAKVRSNAIRKAAKGKPCTLRISSFYPGHFCSENDTTAGDHGAAGGKGMSTKETDLAIMFGCQNCHDILDRRDTQRHDYIIEKYPLAYGQRLFSALVETHAMLVEDGVIVVPGADLI